MAETANVYFSQLRRLESPMIQAPGDSASGDSSFLVGSVFAWRRNRSSFPCASSHEGHYFRLRGLHPHALINFQTPHLLVSSHWGLGLQLTDFGENTRIQLTANSIKGQFARVQHECSRGQTVQHLGTPEQRDVTSVGLIGQGAGSS